MIDTPNELKDFIVKILEDKNAQNITVLKLGNEVPLATYMIFASGRSSKNVSAIGHYLADELKLHGLNYVSLEGFAKSDWVILDTGNIIVHLFHPEAREYYKLEELWQKS